MELNNIQYRNLADGLSANAVSDTTVSVQVIGVESVINSVTDKDISAYVDLSGFGVGDYEAEVQIENNDPRLNFIVNNKIGIKITNE